LKQPILKIRRVRHIGEALSFALMKLNYGLMVSSGSMTGFALPGMKPETGSQTVSTPNFFFACCFC
jgi:hypothetical protein